MRDVQAKYTSLIFELEKFGPVERAALVDGTALVEAQALVAMSERRFRAAFGALSEGCQTKTMSGPYSVVLIACGEESEQVAGDGGQAAELATLQRSRDAWREVARARQILLHAHRGGAYPSSEVRDAVTSAELKLRACGEAE
jgi:hypothetical protein